MAFKKNAERTGAVDMKKLSIIVNAADHEELSCAIAAIGRLSERGHAEVSALRGELARAEIVAPENTPPDVITMNSRAEVLDLDSGERLQLTVVFPCDADVEQGKISVLAPLGAAMLGQRVGDEFEWPVPYGRRRLRVLALLFQPEAVLASAA
jgi:regulator of nucleoside diphosphate kinase